MPYNITEQNGLYRVDHDSGWRSRGWPTNELVTTRRDQHQYEIAEQQLMPPGRTLWDGRELEGNGGDPDPGDPIPTTMQSSVSQYGITVTFDQDYPCGQFVNDDWFVVGNPTVSSIDPAWSSGLHGAMVNPEPNAGQGIYDKPPRNGGSGYNGTLNFAASLPSGLSPGDSLVCSKGRELTEEQLNSMWSYVTDCMVVTCLSTSPPEGSFRPQMHGGTKELHNVASLRWDVLDMLTPPASAPSWAATANKTTKPWLDFRALHNDRHLNPSNHMSNYGREIAADGNQAILMLNCDYTQAQKQDVLYGIVQIGIDQYGQHRRQEQNVGSASNRIQAPGWGWPEIGGALGVGRKWPALFAGIMLDDPAMRDAWLVDGLLGPATGVTELPEPDGYRGYGAGDTNKVHIPYSQEDGQTYIVPPNGWNHDRGVVGEADWAERAWARWGSNDIPGTTSYRHHSTRVNMAATLACLIMQGKSGPSSAAKALWNHQPTFDYADWYVNVDQAGSDIRGYNAFFRDMWDTYRSNY